MKQLDLQYVTIAHRTSVIDETIEFANTTILDENIISGVKIYSDIDTDEPLYGYYYEQSLVPGTKYYTQRSLTLDEFTEVIKWLAKDSNKML